MLNRDDDARCQMLRRYMTLLRHVARLVADAANGASAQSRFQTSASALPAARVVSNSATEKQVCNSGATETLNAPTFMPTVSMEESRMIMSYTESIPRIRKQLNSLPVSATGSSRSKTDTQVLLPFGPDSDQASTAAPADDEQDLFGREEALRLDEEIMDFQWFVDISWDCIKDLRDTTYVHPPPRFKFALQHAPHAIPRAITHHNP